MDGIDLRFLGTSYEKCLVTYPLVYLEGAESWGVTYI